MKFMSQGKEIQNQKDIIKKNFDILEQSINKLALKIGNHNGKNWMDKISILNDVKGDLEVAWTKMEDV